MLRGARICCLGAVVSFAAVGCRSTKPPQATHRIASSAPNAVAPPVAPPAAEIDFPASTLPVTLAATAELGGETAQPTPVPEALPASYQTPALLSLTLDDAIAVALDRNPNLVALRASEPVARSVYRVAETYPWNPYVQLEVLPYARGADGDKGAVTNYVLLMQTLELAHQKSYREAGAAAALTQVRWNVVQAELASAAQAERLFFTALYQRDLRDLQRETAALNDQLQGIVERQFEAALATGPEVAMAQSVARRSRKQAELADTAYHVALQALRRQVNLVGQQQIELTGSLEQFDWIPVSATGGGDLGKFATCEPTTSTAAALARVRPDVLAAAAGVSAARAGANLARANRIPNLQAGPFYERDDAGTVFAGFRTQTDLPIWNTGKPLVAQRDAELRQQMTTCDQLRLRAIVEAETAIERYESALAMVAAAATNTPDTQDELQRVVDQYQAGQGTILNVLATQTSLLQERRAQLDMLNEIAQAAADVTMFAGVPPARLITLKAPASPAAEPLSQPIGVSPLPAP